MNQKRKNRGLYADANFLRALESGSSASITASRQEYLRKYKAVWRRNQRSSSKNFCISLSKHEHDIIRGAADKHKVSCTRFIKQAALGYTAKRYIAPDTLAVGTIRQEITYAISFIKKLVDENLLPFQFAYNIKATIESLERRILFELECPKTLEQLIVETIQANPGYGDKISELLKSSGK